jgi:predicted ATPase
MKDMEVSIQIENFKSIRKTEMHLRKGLNILIGPNGSGKTCVLGALKFVRDVLQLGVAHALARSGGAKSVYRRGAERMTFRVTQSYGERKYRRRPKKFTFLWEFTVGQSGPEKIATILREKVEMFAVEGNWRHKMFAMEVNREKQNRVTKHVHICSSEEFGHDFFSVWNWRYSGKSKRQIREDFLKVGQEVLKEAVKDKDKSLLLSITYFDRAIEEVYAKFVFLNEYNVVPDVAREAAEQLQFARMRSDGGAVSEVIHALERRHFHKIVITPYEELYEPRARWHKRGYGFYEWRRMGYRGAYFEDNRRPELESVLGRINKELATAVKMLDGVGVEIDPTSGKRFVVFKREKEKFYPNEVSDGTVKWLCILVSIFVPYVRVYLLEEPENFLHPWMQQRLVCMMREQAEKTGTVFVLTSHSATILNAAKPEEILVVGQGRQGTKLSEIAERSEIEQVLAGSDFGLGDLWVSGAFGGVPTDE